MTTIARFYLADRCWQAVEVPLALAALLQRSERPSYTCIILARGCIRIARGLLRLGNWLAPAVG